MYGWVPLLSTWNYHNIVIRLYSNRKSLKKKKTTSCKALYTKQRSLDLSNRPKLLKLGRGGLCPQECDMVCHSINKASLPRCPLRTIVLPNNKERWWRREIDMKFQDKPGNSKLCPAKAVLMTDNLKFVMNGEQGGCWVPLRTQVYVVSTGQPRLRLAAAPHFPCICGSMSSHSPGRCEGPQVGGCQGVSR